MVAVKYFRPEFSMNEFHMNQHFVNMARHEQKSKTPASRFTTWNVCILKRQSTDRLPVQGVKKGWGGTEEGMGEANGN